MDFRWGTPEIAFVLAYNDWCLHRNIDYEQTVGKKLSEFHGTGKIFTYKAVRSKLQKLLRGKPTISTLLREGTRSLQPFPLRKEWAEQINALRDEWDLGRTDFTFLKNSRTQRGRNTNNSKAIEMEMRDVITGRGGELERQRTSNVGSSHHQAASIGEAHTGINGDRSLSNLSSSTPEFSFDGTDLANDGWTRDREVDPGISQTVHETTRPMVGDSFPAASPVRHPYADKTTEEAMIDSQTSFKTAATPSNDAVAKLELLGDTLAWVRGELISIEGGATPDMAERLKIVKDAVPKEFAVAKLTADIKARYQFSQDCADQYRRLTGSQTYFGSPELSHPPPRSDLDREWKFFQRGIKGIFGHYDCPPSLLEPYLVGYLAARIADVFDGRYQDRMARMSLKMELVSCLETPVAAQSLLSAFTCWDIFIAPEPMCEGQHSRQTIAVYEQVRATEGFATVQKLDRLGTRLLFADKEHCEKIVKERANLLSRLFSEDIQLLYPSANGIREMNGRDPEAWFTRLVRLKQVLITSPKEYQIHSVPPGILFDPQRMEAEDVEGWPIKDTECVGKKVKLCLFPALAVQPDYALPNNAKIEAALASHRNFFPSHEERNRFESSEVISKARVLLE